jgi:hypothetical protein
MDVAQLKMQLRSKITIDDLLLAILHEAIPHESGSTAVVPKSNAYLQKAFFAMREQHHGLLDRILFDRSSFMPYSEDLDEALFRLEASMLLSTLNPSYQFYSISPKAQELLSKSYRKFSESDQEEIKRLGSTLKAMIEAGE